MSTLIVRGGHRLTGRVKISGAKNAVLPILAASILADEGVSIIREVPYLEDVRTIEQVIASVGTSIAYDQLNETMTIDAADVNLTQPSEHLVRLMRASFLVMGPLLARFGRAKISLPGGCAIGSRPIDQHLKGFEAMGAQIAQTQGAIEASTPHGSRLKGARIYLDIASVGATENIMMAATLADGTTIIENAAKEPEVVDLANYLNAMGANVRGAGTDLIRIEGVERLRGAIHTVIPDRVEAGTFMVAAAITSGNVTLDGVIVDHLLPITAKLREMGVHVTEFEQSIQIQSDRPLKPVNITTIPHPGFPTDMQAQMMALALVAEGTSIITETLFENRFMHVEQLQQMNASIRTEGGTAIVSGPAALQGANVMATDLRAGAALICAALAADGETVIEGVHHIDRGYLDVTQKLAHLGANILRIDKERMPNYAHNKELEFHRANEVGVLLDGKLHAKAEDQPKKAKPTIFVANHSG